MVCQDFYNGGIAYYLVGKFASWLGYALACLVGAMGEKTLAKSRANSCYIFKEVFGTSHVVFGFKASVMFVFGWPIYCSAISRRAHALAWH